MKSIKPPKIFSNLYRDLRDRHLLLPALGLIVALVAVPIVLSSSTEPQAPLPTFATGAANDATAVTSAVLADGQVSVRDYHKRLEALKSKNPFKPQFTATAGSKDAAADDGSASDGATDTTSGSTATTTSSEVTGGGATETTETTQTTETTTTESTGDGSGGTHGDENKPHEPSADDVEVVNHLFTRRVDLTIGLEGDPKVRENVKPMTILPDEATPVVAFLGTDESGKRAAFVVSKDATVVASDGACVPVPENCLYLTLTKGQTAKLDFGPDGQTFELRLLAIRDVEVKAE